MQRRQLGSAGAAGAASGTQRRCQPCAAAPLPLFQLADAEVLYEATGVPLVDELMKLSSVSAAAHRSLHLLAVLAGVALLGSLALRLADSAADARIRAAGATGFSVGAALVAASYKPCKVMLPLYCAARAATVVLALGEVAARKLQIDPVSLLLRGVDGQLLCGLRWCTLAAGAGSGWDLPRVQLMPLLEQLTQLVQDCSELILVVAVAWAAMRFKSRAFAWRARCMQLDSDPYNDTAVPLLHLANNAVGAVIVIAAIGTTLVGFGINIGALLASIGGVGVVLGIASQQLLANLASAVTIFVTRPFVPGDQVQLLNPEGVEIDGTVLNIEPSRTILRDASSGCIVHINNADVGTFVIKNFTQNGDVNRLRELTAGLPSSVAATALRTLPELAGGGTSSGEEGPGGVWQPAPAA